MIRRDDAPARAIGGPSRVANFQRLQAAAAIKLQVFLGLGRCCQRAFLLLNHRAKRGPEHFDPGRLSPDRHPLRVTASLPNWPGAQNKIFPLFPVSLPWRPKGRARSNAKQGPNPYYGFGASVGKCAASIAPKGSQASLNRKPIEFKAIGRIRPFPGPGRVFGNPIGISPLGDRRRQCVL
jgi:hypothetical protein